MVRCNAICPGWIMTVMAESGLALARNPDAARADALRRHCAGRFGQASDAASPVSWLACDQSSFVTGQCCVIDGERDSDSPLQAGMS
jgi:NAD(P)-dependent dehydrogenase (short-subunit alcohol dehydrogenase family)